MENLVFNSTESYFHALKKDIKTNKIKKKQNLCLKNHAMLNLTTVFLQISKQYNFFIIFMIDRK